MNAAIIDGKIIIETIKFKFEPVNTFGWRDIEEKKDGKNVKKCRKKWLKNLEKI